ncbi:MarR family winged helix-turn-helix transcriptional regulator [Rhodococcus sp. 3Y1]
MTTDEHVRGRVWRDLVVSHSVILGKMEADLRTTTGLTLGQYDVLLRLHEAPGNTIRMGDLAELVLVTTSGVTRVVDRLVEAGLVERVRPDNDRRVVTVSMTPAGKKTLRKRPPYTREGPPNTSPISLKPRSFRCSNASSPDLPHITRIKAAHAMRT